MKPVIFVLSFLSFLSSSLYASTLWQDLDNRTQSRSSLDNDNYRQLQADQDQLKSLLWTAPTMESGMQGIVIDLPLPDGSMVNLEVFESPVLAADVAKNFPDIKTFKVRGIENTDITGRLDFTTNGFHAMLRTADGIIYINPETNYVSTADRNIYRSVNRKSQTGTQPFVCKTENHTHRLINTDTASSSLTRPVSSRNFGTTIRTYRLALSATRQYSMAVASGNRANTYAEMVTAINRVNEIYERDVAIRLQLVSGTELIATNNSQFTDDDAVALLEENQAWIDSKTLPANYDVGHIFSTGGGGLAFIAAACDIEGFKAQGVTGSSNPTTDAFYIDYVAHEIGHQFGASHTFNAGGSTSGSCDSNNRQTKTYEYSTGLFTTFLAASAYEVGSGSTIMAYAGICTPQDLQSNSDAYFHARSIEQIREFVDGDIAPVIDWADGSRCGVNSSSGDTVPVANAGSNRTIPARTPFVLTGNSTNASNPVYTWEQYDLGSATTTLTEMHSDQGSGPLIRSREGSTSTQRFIPALNAILSGNLGANIGERLPTTDRSLTFRLTVRSGNSGISQDTTIITVDKDAGPFIVTAPTNTSSYTGLDTIDVLWNVANTTASPVNCSQVDIHYSVDGGNTFPTLLLDNTDNDGGAEVHLPNTATSQGRIKVACSNNIFFNVSPKNFTVTSSTHYLSISGSPSLNEGNTGTKNFSFTVSMNQASTSTVTVDYTMTGKGSNPANGKDFGGNFPEGSLTFATGETSKTLNIAVTGDTLVEANEQFTVTLDNPVNAYINTFSASGTIKNDDTGPTLNIAATDAELSEGNTGSTAFTFTVTRKGTATGSSSVDYAVTGSGTNTANAEDFADATLPTGTVNFAADETNKVITLNITGDNSREADETFSIILSNATSANIDVAEVEGTIINDDIAISNKKKSGGGSSSLSLLMLLIGTLAYSLRQRRPD